VEISLASKEGEALSPICERINIGGIYGAGPALPQWFAAYTSSRHEKHVSEFLTNRAIENFLPLYRTVRRWKKRSPLVLELPLFPNYLFVHITPRARGSVLAAPGVLSMVGSEREAWPLPDSEIEALRVAVHLRKAEPHPYLVVGERARIVAGPLAGLEGVLARKKNNFRVVLTIDEIMQSFAVEVDADELEPVVHRLQPTRLSASGTMRSFSSKES